MIFLKILTKKFKENNIVLKVFTKSFLVVDDKWVSQSLLRLTPSNNST